MTAGTGLTAATCRSRVWFTAAWLVGDAQERDVGRSCGCSWASAAKSAWLLLRKLRAAMVDPDREPLAGLVEVDETSLPFRAGRAGPAGAGPVARDKLLIAGSRGRARARGGTRLAVIGDYSAACLAFLSPAAIAEGSTVVSDGWSGYAGSRTSSTTRRWSATPGPPGAALGAPGRFAQRRAVGAGRLYHGLRDKQTSRPTSTKSCFRSTGRAPPRRPSSASSASASPSSPPPAGCSSQS